MGYVVRSAKPRDRAFNLYDERELFLLVTPTGGRLWRLKDQLHGHEKLISLGAHPGGHIEARVVTVAMQRASSSPMT